MKSRKAKGGADDPLAELGNKQADLEARLDKGIADLQKGLSDRIMAEAKRLEDLFSNSGEQTKVACTEGVRKVEAELANVRQAVALEVADVAGRADALDSQVATLRAELAAASDSASSTRHAEAEERRGALDAAVNDLTAAAERQVSEAEARCMAALGEYTDRLSSSLHEAVGAVAARCDALRGGLDGLAGDFERARALTERAQMDLAVACEGQLAASRDEFQDMLQKGLDRIAEGHSQHSADVDLVMRRQRDSLRATALVAENIFTRSVAWRIHDFHHRLAKLVQAEQRSLQSPVFSVCSLPEMVLELLMASRDDGPTVPLPNVASLPLPGSCSVRLWAPPGIHMAFRLSLGEGSSAVSRRFEHTFQPSEDMDNALRVNFQVLNFCQLDQVWVRKMDMVQFAFELLEFRLMPNSSALARPRSLVYTEDEAGEEDAGTQGDSGAPVADPATLDEMLYTRISTSEALVHERIKSDFLAVRNQSVRRIEWRVEGCARLLDLCRVGEAVDSPPFGAGGLERIQFHFYPRGYDASAAGNPVQPCSLFVSGPARATLRGTLWVGSFSRQFEHRFQRRGDVGGRSKFGPLEQQLDCDDAVLIALDIVDVEVDLPEISASLCIREARSGAGTKGGTGNLSPVTGSRGSIRMKREDPSRKEELVKCVSLPTLNARQLHAPLAGRGKRTP